MKRHKAEVKHKSKNKRAAKKLANSSTKYFNGRGRVK